MIHSPKPLISIIVPVYNADHYLDRCIQSVIIQDYPNWELLLVDDGSTDQSGEICDSWSAKDQRIHVIHQPANGGLSRARNVGLDHAGGEFISFIDADDYVAKDCLSYLLSLFSLGGSHCGITACNHVVVRKKQHPATSSHEPVKILSAKEAMEEALFHGCIDVSAWGKLYRKSIFHSIRFPEGKLFEDTWLFGRLIAETDQVIYGSRCCYFYTINEGSLVRRKFSLRNLQYIEAARTLASYAKEYGADMDAGCVRRVNHARFSVLRYMKDCRKEYLPLRQQLRGEILRDAPLYIKDPRTPKRDRMAYTLLRTGMVPFYIGWDIYEDLR